jgi:hypothetical protein
MKPMLSSPSTLSLDSSRHWRGKHRGITIEIAHWGLGQSWRPEGVWNYYLIIHERKITPEVFASLWLEDQTLDGYGCGCVSHDYYGSPLGAIEMHGGITFYEKNGHSVGHRYVKFGCDYNHSWDDHRRYTLDQVSAEAVESVNDAIERLGIKEDAR